MDRSPSTSSFASAVAKMVDVLTPPMMVARIFDAMSAMPSKIMRLDKVPVKPLFVSSISRTIKEENAVIANDNKISVMASKVAAVDYKAAVADLKTIDHDGFNSNDDWIDDSLNGVCTALIKNNQASKNQQANHKHKQTRCNVMTGHIGNYFLLLVSNRTTLILGIMEGHMTLSLMAKMKRLRMITTTKKVKLLLL